MYFQFFFFRLDPISKTKWKLHDFNDGNKKKCLLIRKQSGNSGYQDFFLIDFEESCS